MATGLGGFSLPYLVGGALCPPLITTGWCPMPGGTLPYLWVVPYVRRNPPRPHNAPPPSLESLWVVPYAGRNPPILVGGALCRVEPSEATLRPGASRPHRPCVFLTLWPRAPR